MASTSPKSHIWHVGYHLRSDDDDGKKLHHGGGGLEDFVDRTLKDFMSKQSPDKQQHLPLFKSTSNECESSLWERMFAQCRPVATQHRVYSIFLLSIGADCNF